MNGATRGGIFPPEGLGWVGVTKVISLATEVIPAIGAAGQFFSAVPKDQFLGKSPSSNTPTIY